MSVEVGRPRAAQPESIVPRQRTLAITAQLLVLLATGPSLASTHESGFASSVTVARLPSSAGRVAIGSAAVTSSCGDATGDENITASDALLALKTAVGTAECLPCVCNTNGQGEITASDALVILRTAVGLSVSLDCPPCGSSTTTTTVGPQCPDASGQYNATVDETASGCQDSDDNGRMILPTDSFSVDQTGCQITGTAVIDVGIARSDATFTGTIASNGSASGQLSSEYREFGVLVETIAGTFDGQFSGGQLTLEYTSQSTAGDTCNYVGSVTATRR